VFRATEDIEMRGVRRPTWMCGLLLFGACVGPQADPPKSPATDASDRGRLAHYGFEDDALGSAPEGFSAELTGDGPTGRWVVVTGDGPLHGQVLAQLDADATEARYPICIAQAVSARDVRASTKFRTVSGEVDQAAGVVVRYRDARTYYMARANALEGNVRFYRIVDGVRKQLASASLRVPGQAWHKLLVEARGSTFRIEYDGSTLFTVEDTTLDFAGRAGVWTKADSVTWFDEVVVESFDAPQ
jgi:hypothetical protein